MLFNFETANNSIAIEGYLGYQPDGISTDPLYAILGISLAVLIADVAFGHLLRPQETPHGLKTKRPVPNVQMPPAAATDEEATEEWAHFKRTKLHFLLLTMSLGFASELSMWMLAPFFPREAFLKGVSKAMVGFMFALHPMALGFSAQFAHWVMAKVDPFVLLQRSLFLSAIFAAGFGLAHAIGDTTPFICCTAFNRFLLGCMSGISEPVSQVRTYLPHFRASRDSPVSTPLSPLTCLHSRMRILTRTMAQAITLRVVPSHAVAYAFGFIIASRFLAMLVGPVIGGALYQLGGYPLPFLLSSGLFLALALLTVYVGSTTPINASVPSNSTSVFQLFRIRGMPIMFACIFLLWFNVMALEPCYQPHLVRAPFTLTTAEIGLILSAATGTMVVTMVASGVLVSQPSGGAYRSHALGRCSPMSFLSWR